MDSIVYAIDTETTGVSNHPVHLHPQVIELASIELSNELQELKNFADKLTVSAFIELLTSLGTVTRYRPSMEIHKRAHEVHGIHFRDLVKCARSEDLKLPQGVSLIVGHNIQYDYRCLGKPEGIVRICTLEIAKKVDKQFGLGFTNHKLDTLITYYYGDEAKDLVENSHQALNDTIKVVLLLVKLLEYTPKIETFTELYAFTEALKPKK